MLLVLVETERSSEEGVEHKVEVDVLEVEIISLVEQKEMILEDQEEEEAEDVDKISRKEAKKGSSGQ